MPLIEIVARVVAEVDEQTLQHYKDSDIEALDALLSCDTVDLSVNQLTVQDWKTPDG